MKKIQKRQTFVLKGQTGLKYLCDVYHKSEKLPSRACVFALFRVISVFDKHPVNLKKFKLTCVYVSHTGHLPSTIAKLNKRESEEGECLYNSDYNYILVLKGLRIFRHRITVCDLWAIGKWECLPDFSDIFPH